jgi:predicted NBD/HSP70 family sugar kinase
VRKINSRSFVRATRSTGRDINRRIVLNLVRDHQPISRADLARRMRIGRGMVTSIVTELLADGTVYEGGEAAAPRGRKPRMLYVRTEGRLVIAIDIRFSRTYVMLSDFGGAAIAFESFETILAPDRLVDALVKRIRGLLKQRRAAGRCEGIGLVVPGMVDRETGRVLNAPQLGWRNVDIRRALEAKTGLQVSIENAPIACALAHVWNDQHGGSTSGDFVYVTVGDGVGAGVVVNGQVVRGHDNTAGEFGHVPVDVNGIRCLCGARGCLEAYTSNLATLSRYLGRELSAQGTRELLISSGLTVEDVIARARAGDARASAALDETARYLGLGLSIITNALNPSRIIVGGEITDAWDRIEPVIRAHIAERALTESAARTQVSPDPATSHARLRGATALVAAPMFAAPQVA